MGGLLWSDLFVVNELMSKHLWPTEIDGFFSCTFVIQNLKILILRQSMPVHLENEKLLTYPFEIF